MKKWIVKQQDEKDCGVCTLLSVIRHYGGEINLETLREDTYTTNAGTSAYNLVATLRKYGFEAQGVRVDYHLNDVNYPAIAHVMIDEKIPHFVVIYGRNKNNITMMDPAKGIVKLSIEQWQKIFTGTIIICTPISKIISIDKPDSIYSLYKKIIKEEKSLIINIIIISLVLTFTSIISSFYLKYSINSLEQVNNFFKIKTTVIIFMILMIIKITTNFIRTYYEIYLSKNIDLHLIIPFLKHLYFIPLNSLKSRSVGDIIERVDELANIKELFVKLFITVFLDAILALSTLIILIRINSLLTIITSIILVIYSVFGLLISPKIKKLAKENIELNTQYNSTLVEDISAMQSIKNLNKADYYMKKLFQRLIAYLKHSYKISHRINLYNLIKDIINDGGMFLLMSLGIFAIKNNNLNVIDLMIFANLVSYLNTPIKNIVDYLPKIEFLKASYHKINDYLNIKEENLDVGLENLNGNIKIVNLSYSYNGLKPVINNLNLEIKESEKVLLKAASGAGKSTLCKLLMRLMKSDAGEILLNQINIEDYPLGTLRNNICYISQDEVLFSDTLKNNIILDQEISTSKLARIAKTTMVDDIISKKTMRYNSFLLEQGTNLSGGEKQRLILARGLLKNCPIIILDEALSEVPANVERKIITNILAEYKNNTIIYVSHHPIDDLFERVIDLEKCYG